MGVHGSHILKKCDPIDNKTCSSSGHVKILNVQCGHAPVQSIHSLGFMVVIAQNVHMYAPVQSIHSLGFMVVIAQNVDMYPLGPIRT